MSTCGGEREEASMGGEEARTFHQRSMRSAIVASIAERRLSSTLKERRACSGNCLTESGWVG